MILDSDCVRFLQWALPQLRMRWAGFRKVHKQVCKRLARRLNELGLATLDDYRNHLGQHPAEWQHLDTLCRVVVTRFYRDRQVFAALGANVLPRLATDALTRHRAQLRVWCIGSASGEEPYTLAILWHHRLAPRFPSLRLCILGTELSPYLIARSHRACYAPAALKNLPQEWRAAAFTVSDEQHCLKPLYQEGVEFRLQDIRTTLPDGQYDLILCRNLVFTYFDEAQQRHILHRLLSRLRSGGRLLLGVHERVPPGTAGLHVVSERWGLYQRAEGEEKE